ncbi:MAG: hypothetical protein ACK479_03965 [Fluviicola sp.]
MIKCKFISNGLDENINELKIASLYFDKIDVLVNNVITLNKDKNEENQFIIRGAHICLEREFDSAIKLLKSEQIAKPIESLDFRFQVDKNETEFFKEPNIIEQNLFLKTQEILSSHENNLFKVLKSNGNAKTISFEDEVKLIHKAFVNEIKIGSSVDFEFIHTYYSNLIFYNLKYLSDGEITLNTSSLIKKYFNEFYTLNKQNLNPSFNLHQPHLGVEAIKYFVPNVTTLEFHDIIELRYKLKSELECYRYFIDELNFKVERSEEESEAQEKINWYLDKKINPSILDLKSKILSSKLNLGEVFLDEIRNPSSYTPFLGNIFYNIPSHISLLISSGLIGSKAYLKWKKEKLNLQNNGVQYLLSINKKVKSK